MVLVRERGVLDVGGSHATAAIVDMTEPAVPRSRSRVELDAGGSFESLIGSLVAVMSAAGAASWTIALPGPFDYPRGVGSFAGVGKFGSLAGVDLGATLSERLGLPAGSIDFVNDAAAYAMGEWWLSTLRPERFICITLGTGVGSAFLRRGQVVDQGDEVPPSGWVHLLRIDGRPLEEVVSTAAIRAAHRSLGRPDVPVVEVARLARAGDESAREAITSAMRSLGAALAPWVQRFAATELVLGGSMAKSWDVLGAPLAAEIGHVAGNVLVRPAVAIEDAPLIGAAVRTILDRA